MRDSCAHPFGEAKSNSSGYEACGVPCDRSSQILVLMSEPTLRGSGASGREMILRLTSTEM